MDQLGGRKSGIKDFDPGHRSCPLIDLIAWFLDSTVSKSRFYCQLHELSKGYGGDRPTHASWVGPVLCLCSELQLLFHSQKSSWWLGVQTASGRRVFFQVRQHLTLPAITAVLEEKCMEPYHKYKTPLHPALLVGPQTQHWFLVPSISFPLSSDPCCFSPGWATHTALQS